MSFFKVYFFYFIIYSFLGWIIEGLFNLVTKGSFKKPNFLLITLKPMYGFAAVFLLMLLPYVSFPMFILSSLIIPTFVEYLSGLLLDKFYHQNFWDYSNKPFNLQGYICLQFSLYWILVALLLLFTIQPLVKIFYILIHPLWSFIWPLCLIYLVYDFYTSSNKYTLKTL